MYDSHSKGHTCSITFTKSVDVIRSDRSGGDRKFEPFLFKGHAGGRSTVESDLLLESTKLSLYYAQDQVSCYGTLTIHAARHIHRQFMITGNTGLTSVAGWKLLDGRSSEEKLVTVFNKSNPYLFVYNGAAGWHN